MLRRSAESTAELVPLGARYAQTVEHILSEHSNTLILADDRAASALAAAIGLPALLSLGVSNVLRLGDAVSELQCTLPGIQAPDHVLVMCSTFLPETYSAMRASLVGGCRFAKCTIACSFSQRAHAAFAPPPMLPRPGAVAVGAGATAPSAPGPDGESSASGGGGGSGVAADAYEACRVEVSRWPLGVDGPCVVRVVHMALPAQLCPLGSSTFLLPVDGAHPLLQSDLPELRREPRDVRLRRGVRVRASRGPPPLDFVGK